MTDLPSLSRGFRSRYLDHAELTAQVTAWAEAFPEYVRLVSLAKTPEGRDVWLLILGREPDRVRPTAWIDGNLHASELAGSSVALAVAEDVLSALTGDGPAGLSPALLERVRAGRFFVVPRISPDGAESVLVTGRYVRSVPRDDRPAPAAPRWRGADVDGDGQVRVMRVQDPTGDYVAADPVHPNLLSAREVDDAGPFWRVYPEGFVEPWDGFTVPRPHYLSDNPIDLNRNFPWSWVPGHQQVGAGPFPASEPESRAIVEYASAHPEIFAWCNLHCYGGVVIRPLGHAADDKLDQEDLAHYKLLERWVKDHTGYPTVSGYHEFLYAPDQPIHGDLVDFAYHARGCFAWTVELWDLFHRLELPKPPKFVDWYGHLSRADQSRLAAWDREHNAGRVVRDWVPATHPQLGPVEVGGLDPRIGVWNPPPELLPEVCAGQSAVFLRVAATAPDVVVRQVEVTPVGGGLSRVDAVVDNVGYLPTYGMPSAKGMEWNTGLVAELQGAGVALVDPAASVVALGHLAGWGRGVGSGGNELAYLRSPGNTASARATWWVRGEGTVTVTVRGARTGVVEASAPVAG
jgi:hypothetical protein